MNNSWLFKIVPIFIGFVFLLIVGYYAALGYIAYKAATQLQGCNPAVLIHDDGKDKSYSIGCKK